jgi:hypothetical protein
MRLLPDETRIREVLAAALLLVGCSSPTGPAPVTRLEVYAVPMIVPQCDGSLTSWTVNVQETGEHSTSVCDEAIVLSDLAPNEPITLAIAGYANHSLCWRGTCRVTPLPGLGIAECSQAVDDVCTDAGAPKTGP